MISATDNLIHISEVAKKLGKTSETVSAWCRTGKLRATKIGRDWYTLWQHVDEMAKPNEAQQINHEEAEAAISRLRRKYGSR